MGRSGLKMAAVDLNHFGLSLKTGVDFTDLKKAYTGFKAWVWRRVLQNCIFWCKVESAEFGRPAGGTLPGEYPWGFDQERVRDSQ